MSSDPTQTTADAFERRIEEFRETASGALQRALDEQKILRDALKEVPHAN